ncbi:hypothetical protein UFOVP191_24 [uncultured Caudovirales phage]|uniref:Uncharacterized protein n=1 Tax=uncultured Caudovirales phage TaxID=2100421 RepID=A0A6J7WFQ5_9CAUD|nr:hypothetical protein UFOVP191_24 [uncultured Caudovirales phage]
MTNMQLWDSVCKTDPSHTKKFTKGGGFSGTAIKPFYLMHKATQTFGVCGIGWGWNELENKMVGGVWCSKVEVWFLHNNQRGVIQQWGQTVMQGKNKNGDFVDEEAPKKAVTDAVTKCLSYLGFAGDVHMGRFDDSKYVDGLTAEFNDASLPVITTEQALELDNLADKLGVNKPIFLEKLGVDEMQKIKARDWESAKKLLALKDADNKKKAAENAKPTAN